MERSNTHPITEEDEGGSSQCPHCFNIYTNSNIDSGVVTPCVRCYKCFVGDCGNYACDCVFSSDDEDEEEEEEDEELCKNCDATYTGRKEPFCIMGHKNCEKGLPHITSLCDEDEDEEDEEECTDANRCEACTYCARTKVCGDCGCVGGCYSSCCGKNEDEE